jgi:hypothetical protein
MAQRFVQRDALVGIDKQEAVDEVLGVVGDGEEGGVGELPLEGVLEDLRDAIVVEGQVARKPAWVGAYM